MDEGREEIGGGEEGEREGVSDVATVGEGEREEGGEGEGGRVGDTDETKQQEDMVIESGELME